jgi:hypothetical protein
MAIAAPMVTRERILEVLAASSAAASLAVAASQIAANARWVAAVKVATIVGNGSHGLGTAELLSLWPSDHLLALLDLLTPEAKNRFARTTVRRSFAPERHDGASRADSRPLWAAAPLDLGWKYLAVAYRI